MKVSIYHRRRFHSDVIKRVIWLYFRFNLSLREIEELMVERGVDVSYETIRRWIEQFGPVFAKRIKARSPNPSTVWHLDEVYTKINGKMVYLWRAVDDEGTVLMTARVMMIYSIFEKTYFHEVFSNWSNQSIRRNISMRRR